MKTNSTGHWFPFPCSCNGFPSRNRRSKTVFISTCLYTSVSLTPLKKPQMETFASLGVSQVHSVSPYWPPLERVLASSSDFKGPSLFLLSLWDTETRVLDELMERKGTVSWKTRAGDPMLARPSRAHTPGKAACNSGDQLVSMCLGLSWSGHGQFCILEPSCCWTIWWVISLCEDHSILLSFWFLIEILCSEGSWCPNFWKILEASRTSQLSDVSTFSPK